MPRLDVIGLVSLSLCCYAALPSDQAQCGKPPKIENALLQGDWDVENYTIGSTATYSCHPGYSLLGRIKRICMEGKWQVFSKGFCRKKSCGHPGEISFGTFELKNGYEFVFGAEVEYYCDEGYQLISKHKTRICAADGWTNFLPHCEARLCPAVMDDSVRVITSVADDEFSMGHVINFQCKNPKHTLRGPSQIYCTEDGTWNVDPPTCKESCTIEEIDMGKNNIRLKNNRGLHVKDNEDVHFQCNYGYNILDPAKLTIQCNNGVLEYPTCQEIAMKPCGKPPQILYGKIKEPVNDTYDSGSSVTYKCQPYFAVYGQEMIQCHDGIWGKPPVCLDEVFTFPHRRINSSTFSASAHLNQGGSVRGNHSHEGSANKFLDQQKQVPQKTENKPCGRPPQIQHGDISTAVNDSYKSGSFVTYKCQKFFTIQGKKKIQCQDGIWDELPVCLAKKPCGRPPQILGGEITSAIKDTYDSGSSVTYKCQKYFRIHGHKAIKCQDGKWGEPPVCLEPCTTSETHMHENHITLIWKNGNNNHCIRSDENENYAKKCYLKHNQIIKFACLPGYTIYNKMELISMCNRGKLSYPRCL